MGPIVVMVRRPSLHIPVPPEDVQDEAGSIQTIARISSFQSEMAGTAVLQGDPPQWVVQVSAVIYAGIRHYDLHMCLPIHKCSQFGGLQPKLWLLFCLWAGSGTGVEAETGA